MGKSAIRLPETDAFNEFQSAGEGQQASSGP